eukprot:COSAG03_NODE_21614_length_302_cov_0.733990_1_plen_67_part_10
MTGGGMTPLGLGRCWGRGWRNQQVCSPKSLSSMCVCVCARARACVSVSVSVSVNVGVNRARASAAEL